MGTVLYLIIQLQCFVQYMLFSSSWSVQKTVGTGTFFKCTAMIFKIFRKMLWNLSVKFFFLLLNFLPILTSLPVSLFRVLKVAILTWKRLKGCHQGSLKNILRAACEILVDFSFIQWRVRGENRQVAVQRRALCGVFQEAFSEYRTLKNQKILVFKTLKIINAPTKLADLCCRFSKVFWAL